MADMKERGRLGSRAGINNNRAVLEFDVIEQVRQRYTGRRGELTALAREFGVSRVSIRNWIDGRYRCQS